MNKKYQVFVSSTYSDLKAERQACVEAILTAGHIPAGMELFSAGDESQLKIIKRWIDESDIYVLLLGGRYGSIEPKTGLSYTELEYNYAIETGKPFFALVMESNLLDEKVKIEGKDVLELSQPDKYIKFKEVVLSKISKFFSNNDRLQLAVMQSLIDIDRRHSLTGWMRADEGVDSAKVLNQISELNERNKELETEVADFRKRQSQKNSTEVIKSLSNEATMLIVQIFRDTDGKAHVSELNGKFRIVANSRVFPHELTPRAKAIWEDVLYELSDNGIVKHSSDLSVYEENQDIYTLTKFGFEVADILLAER